MFIPIMILILLLPVTFLSLALETSFSYNELKDMGVCLENPVISPSNEPIHPSKKTAPKMQAACGNA